MKTYIFLALIIFISFGALPSRADATISKLFTDHMVLQRDCDVPVWGRANPEEKVTVSFAGQSMTATTDNKGRWSIVLKPLSISTEGRELIVKANNTIKLKDVVVGDVWLCGGQSNMEYYLRIEGQAEPYLDKTPMIRHVKIKCEISEFPNQEANTQTPWLVCNKNSAKYVTAVGYFFAVTVQEKKNIPIGLIGSNWGGTAIESWISPEGYQSVPELQALSKEIDKRNIRCVEGKACYVEQMHKLEDWYQRNSDLKPKEHPDAPIPQIPSFKKMGGGTINMATMRYNAMIYPLKRFPIKGVLWYQGCNNMGSRTGGSAVQYFNLSKALINGWRKDWGYEFPFYCTVLAGIGTPAELSTGGDWDVRGGQVMCMQIPKVGVASAYDVGEPRNIHPANKLDVGKRLAAWALSKDYGYGGECCGPVFKKVTVNGNKAIVAFDHIGSGLMAAQKNGDQPPKPEGNNKLNNFSAKGKDNRWKIVPAEIVDDAVILDLSGIDKPKVISFSCVSYSKGFNFYNKEGFPAFAFSANLE